LGFNAPPKRPPHPATNVRDDRDTPPPEGGTAQRLALIWVAAKRNIFAIRLDGPNQFEAVHEFSFFAHAIFTLKG
jgi:hypothetical protein